MEFVITVIIAILAIIVVFPYMRFVSKRISLYLRLKSICKKQKYSLIQTHPGWLFAGRNNQYCDFYVEAPNEVYSVKLFPIKNHKTTLIFKSQGKYIIRTHLAMASNVGAVYHTHLDSKVQNIMNYDFRYKFRDEWHIKEFKPILLINPTCIQIIDEASSHSKKPLGVGEVINGMIIQTSSSFIRELSK